MQVDQEVALLGEALGGGPGSASPEVGSAGACATGGQTQAALGVCDTGLSAACPWDPARL